MTDAALMQALEGVNADLVQRIVGSESELRWLEGATGDELLEASADQLSVKPPAGLFGELTAVEVGNLPQADLVRLLEPHFAVGTATAEDLADQIQLCRAFSNPTAVTNSLAETVLDAIADFPMTASDLKVGSNRGDVLDPFILAANYELLSQSSVQRTIETTASHKVLMKIEDLVGHLHEAVIGQMRGNFRIPEPQGREGKELLDRQRNPFPGADVGQVPRTDRAGVLRLFQVKNKTGSAKGGDGARLGKQLLLLEETYGADTFYVAIVGNTLSGHRSRGAVERESPNTAILVGEAALDELTQSKTGGELLLRTYRRAFRAAAQLGGYDFEEVAAGMVEVFEAEAGAAGEDFLSAWLHGAIGGDARDQDSRLQSRRQRRIEGI